METVEWLIDKLKRQFDTVASPAEMLTTLQVLQNTLAAQLKEPPVHSGKIAVLMPAPQWNRNADAELDAYEAETLRGKDEQRVVFELDPFMPDDDPDEPEATQQPEVAELMPAPEKHTAYLPEKKPEPTAVQAAPVSAPPPVPTPPVTTPPPSVEAVEMKSPLVETDRKSLNDLLERPVTEMFVRFQEPIKDLKKAISINDRYQYMNNLFGGDEALYDRSIKTINHFNVFSEAEYWIHRELATKHGWDEANPLVQQFFQLVSRRFS